LLSVGGMSKPRVCVLVLHALVLVGCGGSSGSPQTGTVMGAFTGMPFVPRFGVARDLVPPNDQNGALEIQLSDAPVDCTHFVSATTWAGPGLYARLYLAGATTGSFSGRLLIFEHWDTLGALATAVKSVSAQSATGALTAADASHVEGTVNYDSMVASTPATIAGSFSVLRCH
jgi:hypothetical protein